MTPAAVLEAVGTAGGRLRLHGRELRYSGPGELRAHLAAHREALWRVLAMRENLAALGYPEPWPVASTKPSGPGTCHSCGDPLRTMATSAVVLDREGGDAAVARAVRGGVLRCPPCVEAARLARQLGPLSERRREVV